MIFNSKAGVFFNKVARLASMLDMEVMLMCYLFSYSFSGVLRNVSYFLACLVLVTYIALDFFWFQELRTSFNYYVALGFCILSALACVMHFNLDFHFKATVRLALDLYVFYLVPTSWNDYEREQIVRFTFDALYLFSALITFVLVLLFAILIILGDFSIANSDFFISQDNRLWCGQNPNTTGSVMLMMIILCVHRFVATKRIRIDMITILIMAFVLLLFSQSRTAIYSVIVFISIFFFFKMQIAPMKNRKILAFIFTCLLAVVLLFGFGALIDLLYDKTSNNNAVESNRNSAGEISSSQRLVSVDYSFNGRSDIWVESIDKILESPFLGYDSVAIKNSKNVLGKHAGDTHNLLLQIALYCGIPCAMIAVLIVLSGLVGFIKNKVKTTFDILLFSSVVALSVEFMAESLILSFLPILYFASLGFGAYYNKHRDMKSDGNNIVHNTSL